MTSRPIVNLGEAHPEQKSTGPDPLATGESPRAIGAEVGVEPEYWQCPALRHPFQYWARTNLRKWESICVSTIKRERALSRAKSKADAIAVRARTAAFTGKTEAARESGKQSKAALVRSNPDRRGRQLQLIPMSIGGVAVEKARKGQPLTLEEYVASHVGFLPGELSLERVVRQQ